MKKKLNLELEALAVDSFETGTGAGGRGTVHARDATTVCQPTPPEYVDCTCADSCVCKSAYYWCGDGYQTLYSCDYTNNESCKVTAGGVTCGLPCTG